MKICILASGSKGNATYIETNNNKILIDVGISSLAIEKKLNEINVNPSEINVIFITHTHSDHISGLKSFSKKYNPKIYLTEKMHKEIKPGVDITNYEYLEDEFNLNDLNISFIKTSHDTDDSIGYIFKSDEKSLVYITDTGYINVKHHEKLNNHTIYIMESNHDVELLMNGSRPYYLKQRILGDKGHLSNKDSAYYLSKFVGNKTKYIVLAHLSEDNNDKDLAHKTLSETLKTHNKKVSKVIIAEQNSRTEMIEL